MHARTPALLSRLASLTASVLLLARAEAAAPDPYRGLWVGQATLKFVNEVSIPLDQHNVPIAPDPNVPTPTADQAHLLIILHVNGAGQVNLLKDVAILNRHGASNGVLTADSDVALVTDESLYGTFPPQPAQRIASAVFDFGDGKATEVLDALVEAVSIAVTNSVSATTADLNTTAGRTNAEAAAATLALVPASSIVKNADVTVAFAGFLQTNLSSAIVDVIAGSANPTNAMQPALIAGTNLLKRSVYLDSRGLEMAQAVLAAIRNATNGAAKTNAAQETAASFADIANDYQRFISGKLFGDMISGAADAAAAATTNTGASAATILTAVNNQTTVNDARTEALRIKVAGFRDSRSTNAVEKVLDAIVNSAVSLLQSNFSKATILAAADAAGRSTLSSNVTRFVVSSVVPTPDYDVFIQSAPFQASAVTAATAAAEGAVSERRNNLLFTATSLKNAATKAASQALLSVYASAARAVRNELPLLGVLKPGAGDTRFTYDIKTNNLAAPLGDGGLTGVIELPANHPTNPFRHRRHPDHSVGFDVTRKVRFDFNDYGTNGLPHVGFGVDKITGTYREEIFGLHKPLGPEPLTKPVGLKVEGTLELNRISLIDTLNAR